MELTIRQAYASEFREVVTFYHKLIDEIKNGSLCTWVGERDISHEWFYLNIYN